MTDGKGTIESHHALSRLALIAFPIVQHYREDLTRHDARILDTAQPGDVFLWTPVPTGTHMIRVRNAGLDVETALPLLEAVEWGYASHITAWWQIKVDPRGHYEITEITPDRARPLIEQHQRAGSARRADEVRS